MEAKLILCVLLGLVAFQAASSTPFSPNLFKITIQEALLKAKDAIYNITVKLESLGQGYIAEIPAIIRNIESISARLILRAEDKIQGVQTSINSKSQELLRIAAERDVDTSYCVATQKMSVDELVQDIRDYFETCDNGVLSEPAKIISEIELLVRRGNEHGFNSQNHNNYCLTIHDTQEAVTCLTDNTKVVNLEAIRLGVQMGEQVGKAEDLVERAESEIPICMALNLINIEPRSAAILKQFAVCVMDKINGH